MPRLSWISSAVHVWSIDHRSKRLKRASTIDSSSVSSSENIKSDIISSPPTKGGNVLSVLEVEPEEIMRNSSEQGQSSTTDLSHITSDLPRKTQSESTNPTRAIKSPNPPSNLSHITPILPTKTQSATMNLSKAIQPPNSSSSSDEETILNSTSDPRSSSDEDTASDSTSNSGSEPTSPSQTTSPTTSKSSLNPLFSHLPPSKEPPPPANSVTLFHSPSLTHPLRIILTAPPGEYPLRLPKPHHKRPSLARKMDHERLIPPSLADVEWKRQEMARVRAFMVEFMAGRECRDEELRVVEEAYGEISREDMSRRREGEVKRGMERRRRQDDKRRSSQSSWNAPMIAPPPRTSCKTPSSSSLSPSPSPSSSRSFYKQGPLTSSTSVCTIDSGSASTHSFNNGSTHSFHSFHSFHSSTSLSTTDPSRTPQKQKRKSFLSSWRREKTGGGYAGMRRAVVC